MHTALALLLAASASSGRRQVSLHEALQLAAGQSPDIAAARAQAAIVHASVNKAWTAWQPDLTASGTYDHTNGTAAFDFGPILKKLGLDPNLFGPPITIVAQNNWYGNAQLTQPLLTPQGLFGPGIARAGCASTDRMRACG